MIYALSGSLGRYIHALGSRQCVYIYQSNPSRLCYNILIYYLWSDYVNNAIDIMCISSISKLLYRPCVIYVRMLQEILSKVKQGLRLIPPEGTPKAVQEIMVVCWDILPKQRPTFQDIVFKLRDILVKLPKK